MLTALIKPETLPAATSVNVLIVAADLAAFLQDPSTALYG